MEIGYLVRARTIQMRHNGICHLIVKVGLLIQAEMPFVPVICTITIIGTHVRVMAVYNSYWLTTIV